MTIPVPDISTGLGIEVSGNSVYFYAEIMPETALALILALRKLEAQLVQSVGFSQLSPYQQPSIFLHINSPGGEGFTALGLYDTIRSMSVPVVTVIDGMCASGATFLLLAGDVRLTRPSGFLMVHQLSAFMGGTHEDFKDEVESQKMMMRRAVQLYTQHTNLTEAQVRAMLRRNTWLNAEQAVEKGFCTDVFIR